MAMVTKTIKLGIHKEIHVIKQKAITDTQELYNRVIAFYMDFFVTHLGVFIKTVMYTKKNGEQTERNWTIQELLTFAEMHTLSTAAHPEPLMPLIDAVPQAQGMPTGLRRAAINHASGKVKGWYTVHKQWDQSERKGGEPQLGEPNEPVTFYADMVDYPDFDLLAQEKLQHTFIAVKLWYEGQWQKVALPIVLPKNAHKTLMAARTEAQRIQSERQRIKASKAPPEPLTPEEKARLHPQEWVTLSLSIYAKRDVRDPGHTRFALHIPLEKYVATPKKAKDQLKENPSMPVVTVDLGVNRLAVMGAFLESRLMATKFIKCADDQSVQKQRKSRKTRAFSPRPDSRVTMGTLMCFRIQNLPMERARTQPRSETGSPFGDLPPRGHV